MYLEEVSYGMDTGKLIGDQQSGVGRVSLKPLGHGIRVQTWTHRIVYSDIYKEYLMGSGFNHLQFYILEEKKKRKAEHIASSIEAPM